MSTEPERKFQAPARLAEASGLSAASRAFLVRAGVLPVAVLAGLASARLTVSSFGLRGYAIYALVVGLPAVIPISDLGVGAAVTDAVARRRELGVEAVQRVIRTSLRVLASVAVALGLTAWALAAMGAWAALLGVPNSQTLEIAVAVALTIFALGIPLGLSGQVLLGAERNDLSVAIQGSASVLSLLLILFAWVTHAPLWLYVASPFAGSTAASALAWPMAAMASRVSLGEAVRTSMAWNRPGARIAHMAGPMLVITTAVAVAYQSDRLLLSHLSTLGQVAVYSVGAQLYAAFFGLVAAAGMSLWPVFSRRRSNEPVTRPELIRLTAIFTLGGILLAGVMLVIGPWVAAFISKGEIDIGYGLFLAFGFFLIVQSSWLPAAMLQTDRQGLKFQAVLTSVMLVVNLGLSALLARRIGAVGPVLGSTVALFLCVWVPGFARALKRAQVSVAK